MTTQDKAVALVDARDIYEVSNQLAGHVGPDTDEKLAAWLLREGKEAAKLADEIVRLRAGLSANRAEIERLTKAERQSRAELLARSKSMLRIRDALIDAGDRLEDEGDRVYFGSTNDADQFRDTVNDLDGWAWHDIMKDGEGEDIYATCREQVARAETAEATITELRKALKDMHEALRPFAKGAIDVSGSAVIIGYPEASEALRRARAIATEVT